jgi:hypothetical protein
VTTRLVLDANMFRGLSTSALDNLRRRGFVISVSETAIAETWARSVKEYRTGAMSRGKARGLLFKRSRNLREFIDAEYPVAVVGPDAIERIWQTMNGGLDLSSPSGKAVSWLKWHWSNLTGVGYTDEKWLAAGLAHGRVLEELDEFFAANLVREKDMLARLPPQQRDATRTAWAALSDEQKVANLNAYARRHTKPYPPERAEELAERIDAMLRSGVWRIFLASSGRQMPKENDGPDLRLLVHIGEGAILLTHDKALIKTVDACGTHQAPGVRSLEDLEEPLPEGPPWGESARASARMFRRRCK